LVHYGADANRTYEYPFSSLQYSDIISEPPAAQEKALLKEKLGISEERVILSIGQFIPRKGFDILMKAAASLEKNIGIYIVGGEPTEEYLKLRDELGLSNVHFVGFQNKTVLAQYYKGAELFVLPTREDIWGLVINEAMAYGLPVITTDRCVAGLELVEDGINGYIVPVEDSVSLSEAIQKVLSADLVKMGEASLEKIRPYTIENMATVHGEIFR
jgi:glycosyltransferase involved in cell wall biosynthesis